MLVGSVCDKVYCSWVCMTVRGELHYLHSAALDAGSSQDQ